MTGRLGLPKGLVEKDAARPFSPGFRAAEDPPPAGAVFSQSKAARSEKLFERRSIKIAGEHVNVFALGPTDGLPVSDMEKLRFLGAGRVGHRGARDHEQVDGLAAVEQKADQAGGPVVPCPRAATDGRELLEAGGNLQAGDASGLGQPLLELVGLLA